MLASSAAGFCGVVIDERSGAGACAVLDGVKDSTALERVDECDGGARRDGCDEAGDRVDVHVGHRRLVADGALGEPEAAARARVPQRHRARVLG